jgi:hypothetical protein
MPLAMEIPRMSNQENTAIVPDATSALADPPRRRGRPLSHGLSAISLHVADEDRDAYEAFREHMLDEIDPVDDAEAFFAQQIVAQRWFLIHADRAEASCLRKIMNSFRRVPLADQDDPNRHVPHSESERDDLALTQSAAHNDTHLILRYRTAHLRALQRMEHALWLYRKLKEARTLRDQKTNYDNSTGPSPHQLIAESSAGESQSCDA